MNISRAQIAASWIRLRAYVRFLSLRRGIPAFRENGPWRIGGKAWASSALRTIRAAAEDDYGMAASAIAFSSFLALLPLLGAVALSYGMLTPADQVVDNIRALLVVLPGEARAFVGDWLVQSITRQEGREFGLVISIVVALYSALRAGRSIIAGLNVAANVASRRGFLRRRAVALLIVLGGAGLIFGALLAISALAFVERAVPSDLILALPALRTGFWMLATVAACSALALIYRYGPAREPPPWRWIAPGALVATLLWLIATFGFSAYLASFSVYSRTYGSIGAIIVLQFWLFLSAFSLLLGARLNTEVMLAAGIDSPNAEN